MRVNIWSFRLLYFATLYSATILPAQDLRVTNTRQVVQSGGRVSWGAMNNLLAFDKANGSGYYDIYTNNPDGSNTVCLTCGASQFPYSKGNPEWHPSNNFLALEIQWSAPDFGVDASIYTPGAGVDNDLYIMDAAGKNYWPVTQNAKGILHPRFSHSGNQLLWVQRTFANNWNLMLADFAIVNGAPQVANVQALPPCQDNVFCETGGFSADDTTVFFTHSAAAGGATVLDIYSYNLSSQVTTNLTNTVTRWNEFPTSFPGKNRILWMSGVFTSQGLETDYWSMNYDGSDKVQLTYYNDSTAPSWYLGSVSTAKFSWSPDGTQLAAYFIPDGTSNGQPGNIEILTTQPSAPTLSAASFARPPVSPDSIVSTFYPNLATSSASTPTTALPLTLGGTSATLTDALNVSRPVPLFFVSPNQVNWEVPADTAPGPALVQFTNSTGVTSVGSINVQQAAPGLFTITATGSGAPAGYVLTYPAGSTQFVYNCNSGSACTPTPVNLGSAADSAYLILFGTGLRHAAVVSATLTDLAIPVSFAGAQGGYPGLDQVNIPLPHTLAGSGAATLTVIADGVPSNAVQLSFQ
jgi:uncharacterized protein (TIGR03437 family)